MSIYNAQNICTQERTEKLVIKLADADLIKGEQAPHFIDTECLMFGWLQAVMTRAIPDR